MKIHGDTALRFSLKENHVLHLQEYICLARFVKSKTLNTSHCAANAPEKHADEPLGFAENAHWEHREALPPAARESPVPRLQTLLTLLQALSILILVDNCP